MTNLNVTSSCSYTHNVNISQDHQTCLMYCHQ